MLFEGSKCWFNCHCSASSHTTWLARMKGWSCTECLFGLEVTIKPVTVGGYDLDTAWPFTTNLCVQSSFTWLQQCSVCQWYIILEASLSLWRYSHEMIKLHKSTCLSTYHHRISSNNSICVQENAICQRQYLYTSVLLIRHKTLSPRGPVYHLLAKHRVIRKRVRWPLLLCEIRCCFRCRVKRSRGEGDKGTMIRPGS